MRHSFILPRRDLLLSVLNSFIMKNTFLRFQLIFIECVIAAIYAHSSRKPYLTCNSLAVFLLMFISQACKICMTCSHKRLKNEKENSVFSNSLSHRLTESEEKAIDSHSYHSLGQGRRCSHPSCPLVQFHVHPSFPHKNSVVRWWNNAWIWRSLDFEHSWFQKKLVQQCL